MENLKSFRSGMSDVIDDVMAFVQRPKNGQKHPPLKTHEGDYGSFGMVIHPNNRIGSAVTAYSTDQIVFC